MEGSVLSSQTEVPPQDHLFMVLEQVFLLFSRVTKRMSRYIIEVR
jgi:hypothetical protein